ncbi:MAG: type transport system ATP-binding protein [Chloroflexota bacterium]|jgi:ABC-2 type transport system ATP-binding protein|nr:type transport system ATP-binding protein [Chloroflexota bacterium]
MIQPPADFPIEGLAAATRGLVKRYGAQPALQGLDLTVPRGVVYGFLGPNGSGKTTTLRLLVGLMRPDAGQMVLLGQPFNGRDRKRLFRVGSLIEQPSFYPYLSGRDNLRALAATGASTPKQRPDQVLDFVGLGARSHDKVKTYSLGMKQRLGIAAALLSDPDLLLLDEPANGLDPAGIVAMRELLRYLTLSGKTVVVSSHILPEVQQLADVIGIIDRGRLVREGPIQQLLTEGGRVRVRVAPQDVPRAMSILSAITTDILAPPPEGPGAGWITVRVPPEHSIEVNRLLAQNGIYASELEAGNDLEAVFLTVTSGAPQDSAGRPQGPPPGWGQPQAGGPA